MKPFFSILILVAVALGTVFVKMELVREGYEILKLHQQVSVADDIDARFDLQYAALTRPQRLEKIAVEKLALAQSEHQPVVLFPADGGYAVIQ